MADYTISGIIDTVILKSKDASFSRPLVLEYLQDTQDEILGHYRYTFQKKTLQEVLSSGQYSFNYNCEHQGILGLSITDYTNAVNPGVTRPDYIPSEQFFEMYPSPELNNSGVPSYYTDFDGELIFPQPLDKNYTVNMRYLVASPQLEDSTSCYPVIPRSFKKIYVEGGLAGIEEYRENFDISAVHQRKVEDLAEDLLARYSRPVLTPGKATTRRVVHGTV